MSPVTAITVVMLLGFAAFTNVMLDIHRGNYHPNEPSPVERRAETPKRASVPVAEAESLRRDRKRCRALLRKEWERVSERKRRALTARDTRGILRRLPRSCREHVTSARGR